MESAIKKHLHNKTNTMKHVSVVMTVVTRYGRKRWPSSIKKLHNNTNTALKHVSVVMTVVGPAVISNHAVARWTQSRRSRVRYCSGASFIKISPH